MIQVRLDDGRLIDLRDLPTAGLGRRVITIRLTAAQRHVLGLHPADRIKADHILELVAREHPELIDEDD